MNAAAAGRPVVIVQVGYLPMTTWPRQAVAERIRYWRANGFAVERIVLKMDSGRDVVPPVRAK